jgi:hypothetical protein
MSLTSVIAAVVDVLEGVTVASEAVADAVLDEPPAKLGDDRTFIVTGDPGEATLAAHHGRSGGAVYQADDEVTVVWARKAARDATVETYPETLAVYLAVRDAIFVAVKGGALGGTITGFGGVRTDLFGALDFWLPDVAFGFQIALLCRHQTEAGA